MEGAVSDTKRVWEYLLRHSWRFCIIGKSFTKDSSKYCILVIMINHLIISYTYDPNFKLQFLAKNLISWGIDFTFEFNWIHGKGNKTTYSLD